MTIDIWLQLLFTLLGAFLVYGVWLRQRSVDREERRMRYATALLVELKSLDYVLRKVYRDENAAQSAGDLWLPMLSRGDSDLLSFEPQTVFDLLAVCGLCDDIRHLRERSRDVPSESLPRTRNFRVRQKAAAALRLLPSIKSQLEAEGAVKMDRRPVPTVAAFEIPDIPDSPFHSEDDSA